MKKLLPTSLCTDRCSLCIYHGWIDHEPYCDYMNRTGYMRGCPAGDKCDKFKTKDDTITERMKNRIDPFIGGGWGDVGNQGGNNG